MANVGPMELFVVLIIALLVLGPKRLPEMGSSLGKGMREFKAALSGQHVAEEKQAPQANAQLLGADEPATGIVDSSAGDGPAQSHDQPS
jgi:sec-independent protein translocase protein TatA